MRMYPDHNCSGQFVEPRPRCSTGAALDLIRQLVSPVMPSTPINDVASMRNAVFFDGPDQAQRISRFWMLLILAAIIASAGVVADSTATVIGAMIVAPLMTPILGTMLALVLADRVNLVRSVLLVIGGAATAVAIGYLVGLVVLTPVIEATNSQVAGRIHPRLIDLLAAVATGIVGSISLVRKDISDTLPGVAIAISLVPPLAVVGLTLESGEPGQALGAMLLFLTNVTAILASGIIIMSIYKVRPNAFGDNGDARSVNRARALLVVAVLVIVIVGTLANSSFKIVREARRETTVTKVAENWAQSVGWDVIDVSTSSKGIVIRVEGQLPIPETDTLRAQLAAAGIDLRGAILDLIPSTKIELGNG